MRTRNVVMILIIALSIVAPVTYFVFANRKPLTPDSPATAPLTGEASTSSEQKSPLRVSLTDGKFASARLVIAEVQQRELQQQRVVPGRLQYNDVRHIELKSPTDGLLKQVLVKPGQKVEKGQLIAVLSSPEAGRARADVLRLKSELTLAERKVTWEDEIFANLQELFGLLDRGVELAMVEQQFESKVLGDERGKILSAYSRFLLADTLTSNLKPLADRGAVSGKSFRERMSEREVSEATFRALREQVTFDVRRRRDQAQLSLEDAQRRLQIGLQNLETVLGYHETPAQTSLGTPLSELQIRAPFAGTIERRMFSENERVRLSEALFVLADTTTIWVAADIREADWKWLSSTLEWELSVHIPAAPENTWTARVHYLGRELSATSESIPLIAVLDNPDGSLRPGMFARVSIPIGERKNAIAVPPAAIMHQESADFVFVEEQPRTYRRVDIESGMETEDWVEVLTGLSAGQRVVVEGAFLLKSELLLEAEE